MTAIRVIFDGKAFIPRQPVSLPAQSEGIFLFVRLGPAARQAEDETVRSYLPG